MQNESPVAFFSYNRPDHTRRALEALARCRRLRDCDFYFFSDGPRTEPVRPKVEATRQVLREFAPIFNARLLEQPENLGLATSIVTGVTQLCAQYGRVIVIEDDLVVSDDFLDYMIQSLGRYENEPRVKQVGGLTLSPPKNMSADAFLLPVTTTWGWATWQRAWEAFSWHPIDLERARQDPSWRELFDLGGSYSYFSMLEDRLAGRNDSWGILWWYAVSRQNGLVVYPTHSLVRNVGFDGSGIHCGNHDLWQQEEDPSRRLSGTGTALRFPTDIRFVPEHLALLEDHFRFAQKRWRQDGIGKSQLGRVRALASRIIGRLRDALQ